LLVIAQNRRPALAVLLAAIAAPLLVAGASASPSPGLPSPQKLPPGAVAVVVRPPAETQTITVHEFKRALIQATAQAGLKRTQSPGQNGYWKLKVTAMKSLLDQSWIPGQAAEMGIAVTTKQIATELAQIKKQNFKTGTEYRKFLKKSHYTRSDVAELIIQVAFSNLPREVVS
jgi:hypothetical protein